MRRAALALTLLVFTTACAQNTSSIPNELYPHPPGSMGNPNARATLITGVTVLLLAAALIHTSRDQ